MNIQPNLLVPDSIWKIYESEHETKKLINRFEKFLIPKLRELNVKKILEVGCGNGLGPIYLRTKNYEAYGIDPFFRDEISKQYPYLQKGVGERLPYSDSLFDLSFAFEVIEHVGTKDGMLSLKNEYAEIRQKFVSELCRVTKEYILIATPNKYFPVDEHASDNTGQFGFRIHSPLERCTLCVSELEKYFNKFGYRLHSFLDPAGYYELERVKRKLGLIGVFGSKVFFKISKNRILGRTFINPHLFLCFKKTVQGIKYAT